MRKRKAYLFLSTIVLFVYCSIFTFSKYAITQTLCLTVTFLPPVSTAAFYTPSGNAAVLALSLDNAQGSLSAEEMQTKRYSLAESGGGNGPPGTEGSVIEITDATLTPVNGWNYLPLDIQSVTYGSAVEAAPMPEDIPGYHFLGWSLNGYTVVDISTYQIDAETVVFYALYEPDEAVIYTVSYLVDGKTAASEQVKEGAMPSGSGEITVPEGYRMLGWSLDGETITEPSENIVTGDMIFRALLEEIQPEETTQETTENPTEETTQETTEGQTNTTTQETTEGQTDTTAQETTESPADETAQATTEAGSEESSGEITSETVTETTSEPNQEQSSETNQSTEPEPETTTEPESGSVTDETPAVPPNDVATGGAIQGPSETTAGNAAEAETDETGGTESPPTIAEEAATTETAATETITAETTAIETETKQEAQPDTEAVSETGSDQSLSEGASVEGAAEIQAEAAVKEQSEEGMPRNGTAGVSETDTSGDADALNAACAGQGADVGSTANAETPETNAGNILEGTAGTELPGL